MWAFGVARLATQRNHLSLLHELPFPHFHLREMHVERHDTKTVIDLVREGVQPIMDLLKEYEEVNAKFSDEELMSDPEKMEKAIEEMNRMREELRKRIGIVNVAVDLIRDARHQ